MAKEKLLLNSNNEIADRFIVLDDQEIVDLIGLLVALLAEKPLVNCSSGTIPRVTVETENQMYYRLYVVRK